MIMEDPIVKELKSKESKAIYVAKRASEEFIKTSKAEIVAMLDVLTAQTKLGTTK
jgi:hypothetical protein